MDYLFIIGTHRTGSKLMAHFFDQEVDGAIGVHQYRQLQLNNILSNKHLCGALSSKIYKKKIKKEWIQEHLIPRQGNGMLYVESNGFNYLSANQAMIHLSPYQVKIIHMVRDPRTAITSHMNWIKSRSKSMLANYIIPYWNLNGRYQNSFNFISWTQKSLTEKLMYNWTWKNKLISELYDSNKGNYMLLRLEDLIDRNTRKYTLESISSFLNINNLERSVSFLIRRKMQVVLTIFRNMMIGAFKIRKI